MTRQKCGSWMRLGVASRMLGAAAPAALVFILPGPALAQTQTKAFDIDRQPLSSALLVYGRQAGLSVLAPTTLTDGRTAPDVKGQMTLTAALDRLLEGSGLRYEFVGAQAVRIVGQERAASQPGPVTAGAADHVVVVGTNIAGIYPRSSPVEVYTADDIRESGAATTGEFVRKLPQNMGNVSPYAANTTTEGSNFDGVNSVDLRGLGVGTTLTLVNGHRLAPSNSGQSVDVSLIPASAIARVEVLTDGASAIYGSDAVGGVMNFVLRDDFDGAETQLTYGGVTSGNLRRAAIGHALGWNWNGGHAIVSYDYANASALLRTDREFSRPSAPGFLTPIETTHSLLASFGQSFGDRIDVSADLIVGRRNIKNSSSTTVNVAFANQSRTSYWSEADYVQGGATLDYRFSDRLTAQLTTSYSEVAIDGDRYLLRYNRNPPQQVISDYSTRSRVFDVMGKLDGVLFRLPGGDMKFSAGGGILEEKFRGIRPVTLVQSAGTLGRRSPYAFVEVFAPLVGPDQNIPFVDRLDLSLAARYTSYEDSSEPAIDRDFGDSTDPKVGLYWRVGDSVGLRTTYGTSFRAPALTQTDPTSSGHTLSPQTIAGVPSTVLLLGSYAMPDLGPERAETYTAGFDFAPSGLPGFRFSGTYYKIDYTDRIGMAPSGGLNPFATPQLLPDLIYRASSSAFIEEQLRASPLRGNSTSYDLSNPAAAASALFQDPNFWVYDTRLRNLALSRQDGFDLSIRQSLDLGWGEARLAANVTRIFEYRQQASQSAAVLTAVGVPGRSPHWRGRTSAALTAGDFNAALGVNYTGSYPNVWVAGSPEVGSWVTTDLNLTYSFGDKSGSRLSLSVQNLFDEDPPLLVMGSGNTIAVPVGFDPANANPLGRVVSISLTKKW